MRQEAIAETKQAAKNKEDGEVVSDDWTEDQTQLLIKAVNLFPAGTASRYNTDCSQPSIFSRFSSIVERRKRAASESGFALRARVSRRLSLVFLR